MVTGFTAEITFEIGINGKNYDEATLRATSIAIEVQKVLVDFFPTSEKVKVSNVRANIVEDRKN